MSEPPAAFATFAETAIEHGVVYFDLELLPSEWVAVPFYEPWNKQWMGPATRSWARMGDVGWVSIVPNEPTLDVSIAFSMLAETVGYLNWYTEVALLFGPPIAIEQLTGRAVVHLFVESCADTFGQGIALLDRHTDAVQAYANFGKQFPHPFHV